MVEKTLKEQRIGVENMQGTESSQTKLLWLKSPPEGLKKRNDKSFRLNMRETSEKLQCPRWDAGSSAHQA